MTFIDHGIQGGLLHGLFVKMFIGLIGSVLWLYGIHFPSSVYYWTIWLAFASGFLFGMWNDVGPWVEYVTGRSSTRFGTSYIIFHSTQLMKDFNIKLRWVPAFILHTIVDEPFHPEPGFNWWPSMWKVCMFFWTLELIFGWIFLSGLSPHWLV